MFGRALEESRSQTKPQPKSNIMLQSIIAVYSKQSPARDGHRVLWHHDQGFAKEFAVCVDNPSAKQTVHGLVAWAAVQGRDDRVEVRFDLKAREFIFPEVFRQRKLMLAAANREKHKLTPFGVQRRQKRRLEEGLPVLNLGWAQP